MSYQYFAALNGYQLHAHQSLRSGKVLVFFLISLPAVFGIVGLVFDAGLMSADRHNLQHATDAGATAAAMDLFLEKSESQAQATAQQFVQLNNGMPSASCSIQIPPVDGNYAGRAGFVEVQSTLPYSTRLMHLVGASSQQTITARAVAGFEPSTAGAAIVVLDPDPAAISVSGIPSVLPSLPALIGGLEVLGVGSVSVNGSVLVNTNWGGVDENGNPAGENAGPPYAISCMPVVSTTKLKARDIRVAGGVDNPSNYSAYSAGGHAPLKAGQLPVPDPYKGLPAPTIGSDSTNVNAQYRVTAQVVSLPLISMPTVLRPGVYDWIEVDSGTAIFQPGVYIIRGVNPSTQIALNLIGGTITANGVMFYITNSTGYDASSGGPDSGDAENGPGSHPAQTLVPSVVINTALLGSSFSPLADPSSPFNGLLVYQRRQDLRPIVIANQNLLLGGNISGTIYAKWGHVIFAGNSTYNVKIVAGTVRLLAVLDMTLSPSALLPPAQDVFLVE